MEESNNEKFDRNVMREHMNSRKNTVHNLSMRPPMPQSLNIELNNTCNHRCLYCCFHGPYAMYKPKPAVMDSILVKRILDQASCLGAGTHELGLYMSGEPFLYPALEEIIRYAKNLEFPYVFLTTNGALVSEERMSKVLDAGLDSIRFSINAADREHYKYFHGKDDFDVVKRNLINLCKYVKNNDLNVSISISVVVTQMTPNIRDEMKDQFGEYVDDIVFFPVILDGLELDESLIKQWCGVEPPRIPIEGYMCSYPFNSMYIDAFGIARPCCFIFDEKDGAWDLNDECDLEKAWNSDLMLKYRSIFVNGDSVCGTKCEDCYLRCVSNVYEE